MQRQRAGAARILRQWRPTRPRVIALLRSVITSFVVLSVTLWLAPGVDSEGLVGILWLVAVVAAVGMLLRPPLLALATVLGGFSALALGACVQTLVFTVALRLAPRTELAGLPAVFVASWIAIVVAAVINWLADAGTEDAFVAEVIRLMRRVRRHTPRDWGPSPDGLLILQFDGVPAAVMQWAVRAGNLPHIGRLLRTRTHQLATWHTGVPATTPAAQAGILHGTADGVPSFRWYEKEAGRLVVANRPRDAAEIERRISSGDGLLADGGVSISNIFSGDATTSLLTISRAGLPGRATPGYAAFMTSPYGFTRAVVLGIGRVFKELHQARVQRLRDIRPRVPRGGAFLALGPLASVLRDLNVSLVAEQMARGAPVIYCDFVDYDEVAHHAGPARPESMEALIRLDQVVGIVQELAHEAARRYHVVVLSDHGQSQGETFQQRHGEDLAELVTRLVGRTRGAGNGADSSSSVALTDTGPGLEHPGPLNLVVAEIAPWSSLATGGGSRPHDVTADGGGTSQPASTEVRDTDLKNAEPEIAESVVVASGNLAMVYLNRLPGRATREQIEAGYPELIATLAAHPGIGVVVVGGDGGPVAVGARGEHRLFDGTVAGTDPLAGYGPVAASDLARHQLMEHVGDLVIISTIDSGTDDVAAFEGLVGSHGGLGGWQTEAMLLHPAAWPVTPADLAGGPALHRLLVGWRDRLAGRDPIGTAASQPAQHPADRDHDHDRREHALPRLGEQRSAEQADGGIHGAPQRAGGNVHDQEPAPRHPRRRGGDQDRDPAGRH
jgi:hypothetical protein